MGSAQSEAPDLSHLKDDMVARSIPVAFDYLTLRSSHLLNVTLADYLPKYGDVDQPFSEQKSYKDSDRFSLPPSHHLTYLVPSMPDSLLLPDGTDPNQTPGKPFTSRMWAGGEVHFTNDTNSRLRLDGSRIACVERIADVNIKGKPDHNLIFVTIERLLGACEENESDESVRRRFEKDASSVGLRELRNVVYMKPPPEGAKKKEPRRLDPPQGPPDFSHVVHPNAKLLFRYSALTFNTHAIHRDILYCRDVEGHRNLVFHGPLSLTFFCTLLRLHLAKEAKSSDTREVIKSITYRNTHPLYNEEPVKFCGKRNNDSDNGNENVWDVWAETPDGALAVTGTVKTETVAHSDENYHRLEDELEIFGR